MKKEFLEGLGLTPEQIDAILTDQTKEELYRWLLSDLNVNPKYIDLIVRATDISALELTDDGRTFKNVGRVADKIKEDFGAFMFGAPKQETKKTEPDKPAQSWETRAQELARKYHERHY